MPEIGNLEEQMKMEMLSVQADVLQKLGDVMEQYSLPKEAWIDTVFKRYMHLPDEVVSVFLTALPSEIEQSSEKEESRIKRAAPSTLRLIAEIDEKIRSVPGGDSAIKALREVVYKEKILDRRGPKWTRDRVFDSARPKEADVVISSFGRHPFEFRRTNVNESKTQEGAATGTIQAKINGVSPKWDDDGATRPVNESQENGMGGASPYRRWMG
jgi:hypothetical protein